MIEIHGYDTETQIFFYEHDFYVFSNFSSFMIEWKGKLYSTSEHAYHTEKFKDEDLKKLIRNAHSAHDALKLAHENRDKYRGDWDSVKLRVMKEILQAKVDQHPYIKKKLLESGDRELIEDSWRDSYWGWGPNKDGENHLGKLWMELRNEFGVFMAKKIDVEDACKAVCPYCKAGMPLRDGVHISTDTKYSCRASGIRKIVVSVRRNSARRTKGEDDGEAHCDKQHLAGQSWTTK